MITDGLRWYAANGGFTPGQQAHLLEVADAIDRAHEAARGGVRRGAVPPHRGASGGRAPGVHGMGVLT